MCQISVVSKERCQILGGTQPPESNSSQLFHFTATPIPEDSLKTGFCFCMCCFFFLIIILYFPQSVFSHTPICAKTVIRTMSQGMLMRVWASQQRAAIRQRSKLTIFKTTFVKYTCITIKCSYIVVYQMCSYK